MEKMEKSRMEGSRQRKYVIREGKGVKSEERNGEEEMKVRWRRRAEGKLGEQETRAGDEE